MSCTFFCHIVCSQSVKNNVAAPSAQLKQILQLPEVRLTSLKTPQIKTISNKPAMPQFNIAKNMAEAKQKCPLLKFNPTLQLEGERNSNEKVGLKWETANGFDNRVFDVERSLGDTMNFEKINFVWANERNAINNKYRLPDNNDYTESSYYRVKLFLNDGRFIYSNIAAVKGYDNTFFTLYPNPASRKLIINLTSKEKGNATIMVYDASGKMVQQQSSFLTVGYGVAEVDVTKMPVGLYTVKMVMPGKQIHTGKFLKN